MGRTVEKKGRRKSAKKTRAKATSVHRKLCKPFVLVVVATSMIEWLVTHKPQTLMIDFTGSVNMYGYPLGVLLTLDDIGEGLPIGYMITSNETTETTFTFLFFIMEEVKKELIAGGDLWRDNLCGT